MPKQTKTSKVRRIRRRKGGRLVIQKRPDMRSNARPKKVHVLHGGSSRLLRRAAFDKRTQVGRFYQGFQAALVSHVGGDPSAVEAELIREVAIDVVLLRINQVQLMRSNGRLDERALDRHLKLRQQIDRTLRVLGLHRAVKQIPDLRDYIEGKAEAQA
jgi:hypothetical protein